MWLGFFFLFCALFPVSVILLARDWDANCVKLFWNEWAAALPDFLAECGSWTPDLEATSEDCDFAAWNFSCQTGSGPAIIWNMRAFLVLIKAFLVRFTTSRETGSFYYGVVLVNTLWSKPTRHVLPVLCSFFSKRLTMPWCIIQLMTESAAHPRLWNRWSQYMNITVRTW